MQQDNSSFWTDIKTFEEKLANSPDSFCFARLSEIYLKVGLVDDALHTARSGVEKHPRFLGGQRALAMACHAKGFHKECIDALKLVTEAMPEDHEAQKLLGRISASAGDYDTARKALRTVLEFLPDDVESRIELESYGFSSGSDNISKCSDEDEEIIEDLELLEEIEVFEEDEPDSGLVEQELPTLGEPDLETHHDPLSTGTLAELYVKQGFVHKALEIYRAILSDNPGNIAVSTRIAELELQDKIVTEPQPSGDDTFEFEMKEALVPVSEAVTPVWDNISEIMPEPLALSAATVQEEAFFAAPAESVSPVVKRQGVADNALAVLEGWLDNIRRFKSCR